MRELVDREGDAKARFYFMGAEQCTTDEFTLHCSRCVKKTF